MNFYPAIDLKNGQFIRLEKGELNQMKIYGNDPVKKAKEFVDEGAKWIHTVDIDGAFEGMSRNMETIFQIKKNVKCKIQVGGGIRDFKTIEKYIDNNLDRIILGTTALNKPEFAVLYDFYRGSNYTNDTYHSGRVAFYGITVGFKKRLNQRFSVEAFAGAGYSMANYKLYREDIRIDQRDNWRTFNRSGEITGYRGGVMITYTFNQFKSSEKK